MQTLVALRNILEMLGGERPVPETWTRRWWFPVVWGLWWALLFIVVVAFSGRSVKFVYIDF